MNRRRPEVPGNDISLKAGNLVSQGWKTARFVPKYVVLGYNHRF